MKSAFGKVVHARVEPAVLLRASVRHPALLKPGEVTGAGKTSGPSKLIPTLGSPPAGNPTPHNDLPADAAVVTGLTVAAARDGELVERPTVMRECEGGCQLPCRA